MRKHCPPWVGPVAALAVIVFLTRLPALIAGAAQNIFSQDELEMVLSINDRFLGVPSMSLAWPGATLQLLGLPLLALDYLWDARLHLSVAGFARFLAASYSSPWHYVSLVRLLDAVVTSAGLALLYIPFRRWLGKPVPAAAFVLIAATLPEVWLCSHMATSEAVAIGFSCAAFAVLFLGGPVWSGALFGLALASKVTLLPFGIFLLGTALDGKKDSRAKHALVFAAACGAAFLLGNPYVWIDTIRFAKSILGNVTRPGPPVGLLSVVKVLREEMSWPALLLPGLCVWGAWRAKRGMFAAGTAGSLLFGTFLIARGTSIQSRYVLPLMLIVVIAGVSGVAFLRDFAAERHGTRASRPFLAGASALALWLFVSNLLGYRIAMANITPLWPALRTAAETVRGDTHPGVHLVPFELLYYSLDEVSAEELTRLADNLAIAIRSGGAIKKFAERRGLPGPAMAGLWTDFSEDEQALLARVTLVAHHREGGKAIRYYSLDEATGERTNMPTAAEAMRLFQRGQASTLISRELIPGETPAAELGGGLHFYVNRDPALSHR